MFCLFKSGLRFKFAAKRYFFRKVLHAVARGLSVSRYVNLAAQTSCSKNDGTRGNIIIIGLGSTVSTNVAFVAGHFWLEVEAPRQVSDRFLVDAVVVVILVVVVFFVVHKNL